MNACSFEIHLKPRASKDRITVLESGVLEIAVTAPPVDNKANEHLISLLSRRLDIPKSFIRFLKGEHSRHKVLKIEHLSWDDALQKLKGKR